MLDEHEKWKAVLDCDSEYDGMFYYGVKTTGIVCRPSCKSKEPKRDNVQFFHTLEEAFSLGFRACKRCRPELIEYNPLEDLAKRIKVIYDMYYSDKYKISSEIDNLNISKNHIITTFRSKYNMTPTEYINKLRIEKAKELFNNNEYAILDIAFECGFETLSTFYEIFKKQVRMTPKEYSKLTQK